MFYTLVYNSTEGLGSRELVAANAATAGWPDGTGVPRSTVHWDRMTAWASCTGFERRKRMASDPVAEIDLVGVRFDGMGRSPGQAGAPQALRAAGLEAALPTAKFTSDVILPAPTSARGPAGFINEPALLAMADVVCSRVRHSLRTGRFPLLYGGDCAVLLAAIPALRDTTGRAGLLFVDAHEDATTMEQSDNGEAANMEIALLLGLTGTHAPEPLRSRLPALDRDTIVMLG
jgi:arginase